MAWEYKIEELVVDTPHGRFPDNPVRFLENGDKEYNETFSRLLAEKYNPDNWEMYAVTRWVEQVESQGEPKATFEVVRYLGWFKRPLD